MGTPYGQYLLDDVLEDKVDAKVLAFLAAWTLSAEQRARLIDVASDRVAIWCYAPGYVADGKASVAAMQELTGFRLRPVSIEKAWASPTAQGRLLGLSDGFGADAPIDPLFAVVDAQSDEVLATYADGSVAVAMRKTPRGTSLFVGVPSLSAQLLRAAAREAGVHLFTSTDCNIYHNGPYLVLHASQDGPVDLNTGAQRPIFDVLTGQQVGQGPQLRLPLRKGETRLLKMD
jgi:hypothetical protein